MNRLRRVMRALFFPNRWILVLVPLVSWTGTAALFGVVPEYKDSALAYGLYALSAYALVIVCCGLPPLIREIRARLADSVLMRRIDQTRLGHAYLTNAAFRDRVSLSAGTAVSVWYALSWGVVGMRAASSQATAWGVSLALYYLVLTAMRTYLLREHRRSRKASRVDPRTERTRSTIPPVARAIAYHAAERRASEIRAYRRTAWFLGALNIPMGGMIILMIRTNSGFMYSGYMIYLSALYTLYSAVTAVVNVIRFRNDASLILSASKILSFVSAAMSVLALQTAMISRFSGGDEAYRVQMNMMTGGIVYGLVLLTMTLMILRAARLKKEIPHA